jgi:hypothetical protein
MKLCWKAAGLTMGLLMGLGIFAGTLLAVYTGYAENVFTLFVGAYPWYEISVAGAFIGGVEGFLDGFIGTAIAVAIYNSFCGCCCKKACKKK